MSIMIMSIVKLVNKNRAAKFKDTHVFSREMIFSISRRIQLNEIILFTDLTPELTIHLSRVRFLIGAQNGVFLGFLGCP